MNPEAERLLSAVPSTITDAANDIPQIGANVTPQPGGEAAAMAGVMGSAIVDADDLAGLLTMAFAWVAKWRKCDAYELSPMTALALGKPWAMVINDWYTKYAPAMLTEWSQTNPGLVKALLVSSVIVGPMIATDMKQGATKNGAASMVREGTSHAAPQPPPPAQPQPQPQPQTGMIWEEAA